MVLITKVQEVISKNKMLILLMSGLIFLVGLYQLPVSVASIQEKMLVLLMGIMIVEDYKHQTIDMRLFAIVFLLMVSMANSIGAFIVSFIGGYLLFRLLFLLSIKIGRAEITETVDANLKSVPRLEFGYLPPFGLSCLLYQGLVFLKIDIPWILRPTHDGLLLLTDVIEQDTVFFVGILGALFLACCFFEYRLHKAKVEKKEIIYGFGDGDVFILAAFMAFLGFEPLMTIFFISLVLQVLCYLIFFLWRKHQNE